MISLFKILLKPNASIKPKKRNFTHIKATNIRNIFLVSMLQQFSRINITGCVILAETRSRRNADVMHVIDTFTKKNGKIATDDK